MKNHLTPRMEGGGRILHPHTGTAAPPAGVLGAWGRWAVWGGTFARPGLSAPGARAGSPEGAAFSGGIEAAPVKEGIGRPPPRCLPPEAPREGTRAAARRAMERVGTLL